MDLSEEFKGRYLVACRNCDSDDIVISLVGPEGKLSEDTGGASGHLSIGCNSCKANDMFEYIEVGSPE